MASIARGIHKTTTLFRAHGAVSTSPAEYGSPLTFQGLFCRGGTRISPCRAQSRREYRGSPALLGLHRKQLATLEGASEFLSSLPLAHRANLRGALKKLAKSEEKRVCYQNTIPFIGFGFLDNFIMITVADQIEETVGVILCISTMAAAGLGNMVSDLAGLGLADQVDRLCRSLGIPDPKMTPAQINSKASSWMALLGRCAGIIMGCIIGMAPLLWISPREITPTLHVTTPTDDITALSDQSKS